ncbi:elongation factor P maturation arginine rhamnosyltransferase EarP [Aquabacterium sp. OR-4]|uniref:elongation factor P maturation arginine rhamnosyltransferase EarP n=1 Tax=Aquabacterium sp. OR-4 TaxID=2978127 RepID=UPI0028C9FBF9|nr:elongation factor P maturation arginine rhamnosyltransferase EarP [Aquabacterium sp. OR-4]MDT7836718.1 elongation factor P maturation arginine rhamnosyltransferase EarP [Aquabacterium sp. OR-4]
MPLPAPATTPPPAAVWDLFCRVIDNHGDLGVCWRLARGLARRGLPVRLWVDDAAALAWMAPQGEPGVTLIHWAGDAATLPALNPGAVVVEAFGCDPPAPFVARMAACAAQGQRPPVWINLEYLSAEAYVERSHRLASPQFSGPGRGLTKWFFYPGFTPATGGLMHDDLPAGSPHEHRAWLQACGWCAAGEWPVSLFCYDNPALSGLLRRLPAWAGGQPVRLLAAPGAAQRQLQAMATAGTLPQGLAITALPWLSQPDYDRLLAGCALNLVRGEDSFARAQLAGAAPMLWQIYPQHDGAHAPKLEAFVRRCTAGATPDLALAVAASQRAINGLGDWPEALPPPAPWAALQARWRDGLRAQTDLVTQLHSFVTGKTLE